MKKQYRNKKAVSFGFTLIEIVVVIVILVTLASIATPLYLNYVKRANVGAAKTQMKLLEDALTGYRLDVGSYPDGNSGLQALVENVDNNEKWNGPYIKPAVPKDPWGNAYVYTSPGEHGDYDLTCYGADGQPGGEGDNADINNWE
ncbi:MAG: type II secretion system major pseudopilin GspG [Lentisphaeria bacterium]|nr:type II secretion system major pseudopilin GspG [Lentisphaeria bacterium]